MRSKEYSIVFIPTWNCNCTCEHCFEKIIPQVIEDGLWGIFFSRVKTIARTMELNKLTIYWQGGEVMCIPPKTVSKELAKGEELLADLDCVIEHHIQTNLLLYTSEWGEIISRFFSGSISSSLDFPNAYRSTPTLNRDEYTDAWMKKKEEAERDGFVVSVVTLPNEQTLSLGAEHFHRFFKDEVAVRNVQINFPFPGIKGDTPPPLDKERLAAFLEDLYVIWRESGRYLNMNPFNPIEKRLLKNQGSLSCAHAYACADCLLAVAPDGEVGQCDCWLSTRKDFNFGNLTELPVDNLLESKNRQLFLQRPTRMIKDELCGKCEYWKICHGGCPIRAFAFTGDLFSRDYYCEVYRRLFSTILESNC
jgi:uncharacterized protein